MHALTLALARALELNNMDLAYIFSKGTIGHKEATAVSDTSTAVGAAEGIRQACIEAALTGYADAQLSGLCREGAWEAAISAIRRIDLGGLVADPSDTEAPSAAATGSGDETGDEHRDGTGDLKALTARLARQFSSPGPPAAGSAAAAAGAMAAGLVEWTAEHTERRGSEAFRRRAHHIRRRAETLQLALADTAQQDAHIVSHLLGGSEHASSADLEIRATESVLMVATRCSQAVTLAAELIPHAHEAFRLDIQVALALAWSATQCSLSLFEANLHTANLRAPEEGTEWLRSMNRRAWRVRLLLRRAAPLLPDHALE